MTFFATQGIVATRMTAEGWADERPVADNTTEEGRAQNRRVEINIAANDQLRQQDAQAAQGGQPQASAQGVDAMKRGALEGAGRRLVHDGDGAGHDGARDVRREI